MSLANLIANIQLWFNGVMHVLDDNSMLICNNDNWYKMNG
jgi:hypothetical protein